MLSFIKEHTNCWDILKDEVRPIYLYGMGDGADKILSVFEQYGIKASGVFASDDFVRGQSFHEFKVQKLSEIEAICNDFVVVLAFAVCRQPTYDSILELSKKHTLYVPDVPVFPDGTLFTYEYCIEHQKDIDTVYSMLADETSKKTFADVINYKISGNFRYLLDYTSTDEVFTNLIRLSNDEVYVDLGAYNGDTILEFLKYSKGEYKKIIGLEPNAKNFKRLCKNTKDVKSLEVYNYASWDTQTTLEFSIGSGRMSTVNSGNATKVQEVQAIAVDTLFDGSKDMPTLLKLDVEGADRQAILGCKHIIENGSRVITALYHRNQDLFYIPLLIHSINPKLKLYIRKQMYIPAWEVNLYCI